MQNAKSLSPVVLAVFTWLATWPDGGNRTQRPLDPYGRICRVVVPLGRPLSASVCRARALLYLAGASERAARPASLAVGAPAQRRYGFALCHCFVYRASAASCRMNASENTYAKLAGAAFYLGFKGQGFSPLPTSPSSGRAKGCALVPPLKSNVRPQ